MEPISLSFEKELEQLRERLEEAEDVRRAITRGEVDAFVIGPGGNTRVLLLANAYQRYRQLVERMQQGAVTVTAEGQILFANQRFSDMVEVPLAQLYTATFDTYVAAPDRGRLDGFLLLSARDSRLEVDLLRRDGQTLPVRLTLASFADGYATVLVTDLRPVRCSGKAAEALEALRSSLEQRLGSAADPQIAEQINGLARLIDEMRTAAAPERARG